MKLRLLSIAAVLCLSIALLTAPGFPQAEELKPEPELVRQMLQEGWTKVAEGVLQRTEGGQLETFTYGEDGLRWSARKLAARLELLEREHASHPTQELAGVIRSLEGQLIEMEQVMTSGAGGAEVVSPDEIANCSISYSATAAADPDTSPSAPGVKANATAYFHATCGHIGNSFAYGYARATAGMVTTTESQEDPKYDSSSADSAASAKAPGSLDCFSDALGRAWSLQLGINYEVSDTNYSCSAAAPPVTAPATRTWVSGVGDDTNSCSRTAPCRTFAGAISKTAVGGEIAVLNPGSFDPVTITTAITIDGNGIAAILSSGTDGIVVNAAATDKVVIRDISINGAGTTLGVNGIRFLAGAQLTVEDVTIERFSNRGIDVSLAASGKVFVKDTNITSVPTGIRTNTTAGQLLTTLDNVRLDNLTNGFEGATNSFTTIRNSVISGNAQNGVLTNAANAIVNLEDSMISFNDANGVHSQLGIIRLSRSSIFNNTTGIETGGGTVQSDGQNRVAGNTTSDNPNGLAIPLL